MNEQTETIKYCPVCNSSFVCKHSSNCWCASLNIPDKVSKELKKNFNDCLCEVCITNFIENAKFLNKKP